MGTCLGTSQNQLEQFLAKGRLQSKKTTNVSDSAQSIMLYSSSDEQDSKNQKHPKTSARYKHKNMRTVLGHFHTYPRLAPLHKNQLYAKRKLALEFKHSQGRSQILDLKHIPIEGAINDNNFV